VSKGVNLVSTLLTSLIVSVIVSAGLLYVAIPMVYPLNVSDSTKFIQMEQIEEQTGIAIGNYELTFQKLLENEMVFTIRAHSSILAQFEGDFESTFFSSDSWAFEIALVIKNVGNRTAFVKHTGARVSINQHDNHNIVINYLTQSLPSGNYTVGVYWRSIIHDELGSVFLKGYYEDQYLELTNTTRTLTLWEIANGN
jgi:hypothetical protein